jgi:glycosyl transferase family 25
MGASVKRIGVFVINLDRDADRFVHMQRELDRIGLAFERFPAVLGMAVPDWLRPWFLDAEGRIASRLKPGEVGVYASHIALHRMLLDEARFDWLLVMEDDCEIAPDLPALIERLASSDLEFDIVKLSNPAKAAFIDHGAVIPGRALVTYQRVPNNLGAYLISRAGAEKTTRYRGLRRYAIDEDMRRDWDWGLLTYGILPAPIRANIFDRSSIDAMGDRGLGREGLIDKLRRRRIGTPAEWARQFVWQVERFGLLGYLGALLAFARRSVAKRVTGAAPSEHALRISGKPIDLGPAG